MTPVLLPTPGEVGALAAVQIRDGSLAHHLTVSALRIVEGFGLAAAAALALGLLVAVSTPARLALEPVIEFVRPIPPLAFLPMFLVWFGLGETSKVAFIAYTTFFPMFVGTGASLLRVDVMLLRAAASLGASRRELLRRVVVLAALLVLGQAGGALAQRPELSEVDAWLVRDAQMSAQFAVADALGYFKEQGVKVSPRWYIAGTDLPSMWGAGNIHLGTATATMVVPIAAAGQAIYNIAPQSDIAGTQQVVLGKRAQEIVRSPKDLEKLKVGMPKGASVTMAIQAMAKDTGVDFAKIQFVNLAPPDEVTVKIVAREMKMDEGLARDIMALNVYSMEMTDKIYRGMGEFVDFLYSLNRIPQKIAPEGIFYTKLLKEVDPRLVRWESQTEVK